MAARVENMFSLRTLSEAGEKKRKKIEKNWKKIGKHFIIDRFRKQHAIIW